MSKSRLKRATIPVVVALLLAALFTLVLLSWRPREELWEWIITGIATLLSLVFALGVFEYQGWRNDEHKRNQFLAALVGELRSTIDSMRSEDRTPIYGRVLEQEGDAKVYLGDARLVRVPPVAAQAAISSALFDAEETWLLTRIVRELLVHDTEVDFLLSTRSGEHHSDTLKYAKDDLEQRQTAIATWCEEIIENLRQQGIEAPSDLVPKDEPEVSETIENPGS